MLTEHTQIPTESTAGNPEGLVSHYPLSSAVVVFSIGLGIGAVLGCILGGRDAPRPSFGKRTEVAAEKLGRQILDSIAGVLPESLAKYVA